MGFLNQNTVVAGVLAIAFLSHFILFSVNEKRRRRKKRSVADGVIGAIGNTPLIKIKSLSNATGCESLAKAEFLNPGGSVKDRVAAKIIQEVMAQQRPVLHRVLDHNDEFFALLMLVLEAHSLQTRDASFSESLYGLRRRPVEIIQQRQEANSANGDEFKSSGLRRHQRALSIIFLVVLPYFKSKLESLYKAQRGAMLQAALWGRGDSNTLEGDSFSDNVEATSTISELQEQNTPPSNQIVKKVKAFLAGCYPWIHATQEGLSFTYQLLYLLDATGFYSPALHAMRVHVCRATGQELMDASSRNARSRFNESERVHGTPWLQTFRGLLLHSLYTTLDYAQNGLIAAVFFFKMMEWWYQSAEERLSSPTVYPPPPPPPQPKVAENGIPLPADRTICPLCSRRRTNPTLIAVSGFVFCYPCIFSYVSKYNRCPVTLMPASVDQLRRLFHDA